MVSIRRLIPTVLVMLAASHAQAGIDPIGWSMTGSIPANTSLNHSYAVNFTLKSNLPFTMPTPLEIANNSAPLSEVTMVDSCSGLKLTPGQTCTVGLILAPKSAGVKQLSVFMEYGKNKVMIPKTPISTTVSGSNSALQASVVGFSSNGILPNATYNLTFTFTNISSSPITGLTLSQNSNNTPGYTQGSVVNCGSTLAAGDACIITGSFVTSATSGAVTEGYTYASSTISAEATTSSVINPSAYPVRTLTFVNNCSQDVWFGAVGGNVNYNGCQSDTQCPSGSSCNPTAVGVDTSTGQTVTGGCFYTSLSPADGNFHLTAGGGHNTVTIIDYGLQYPWNGNVAGRTYCSSTFCQTGDCGTNSHGVIGVCPTGVSFDQPATLGEITMLRNNGTDSYDVSILNATNIPVEMTPTTTGTFNPASGGTLTEFSCTSPGNPSGSGTAPNNLAGCPWTFAPPSPAYKYIYVKPTSPQPVGGLGCTSDGPCSGGDKCGLYYDRNASPTTLNSYCGTVIGYDTQNQVCSFKNTNADYPNAGNNPGDTYFSCDSDLPSAPSALTPYTFWAMYACKPQAGNVLGTCYDANSNPLDSCCGCTDWSDAPTPVHVPSNILQCPSGSTNPTWRSDVLPNINFMKTGCPTAYAYPFDDQSVSFKCSDASNLGNVPIYNQVNYTITFCPS